MRRSWKTLAALGAVAVTSGLGVGLQSAPARAATPITYGVLGTDPSHLQTDTAAGLRLATVTVGWNMWQPNGPNQVNTSWVSYIQQRIRSYEAQGWQVLVDPGLEYVPAWVLKLPNGQLTDQNGHQSGTPNFEWNPVVQSDMVSFLKSVVTNLASVSPQSYRITTSSTGELLYANDSATSWWAYGDAQTSSPMPGWVPGQATWNGHRVTEDQTWAWYQWYIGGLVNTEHAELSAIRDSGFWGQVDLPMPGDGMTPSGYWRRMAENLATDPSVDQFGTMDTGAVWWRQLNLLAGMVALGNTSLDITSVGDGTGTGACSATDTSYSLYQADPWVTGWSDTRWLSYLAHSHAMGVVGENGGGDSNSQMSADVAVAHSCGFSQLLWNSDDSLYAGGNNATLANYQTLVSQH